MNTRSRNLLIALAFCGIVIAGGCAHDARISSTISLSPRDIASIQLDPEHVRKVELENRGGGIVSVVMTGESEKSTVRVNLGSPGHFSSSARGMRLLTLENLSDEPLTIDYIIHGKGERTSGSDTLIP